MAGGRRSRWEGALGGTAKGGVCGTCKVVQACRALGLQVMMIGKRGSFPSVQTFAAEPPRPPSSRPNGITRLFVVLGLKTGLAARNDSLICSVVPSARRTFHPSES